MRILLVICICAALSIPVAMAAHHGEAKKMESVNKQAKPHAAEGVSELKKSRK